MKNVKTAIFLLVSQFIYVLLGIVWLFVAVVLFMVLADPGILNNATIYAVNILLWLFPIILLGSVIISWVLYHKRVFRRAVWVGLIPIMWVIPIVVLLAYIYELL